MRTAKEINDQNISQMAEALIFYEKYEPVIDFLERKKELWLDNENYLQLSEIACDYEQNPEFSAFLKYLRQNNIPYQTDRNNHIKVPGKDGYYFAWAASTEKRIEKWSYDGIPLMFYYTEKRSFFVAVAGEDEAVQNLSFKEAVRYIFG